MAYLTAAELRAYLGIKTSDTFTANAGADTLTLTDIVFATESLQTATPVTVSTTNTLPAPLAAATVYYVILNADAVIQLATTSALAQAGTQINITDAGIGTHTLTLSRNDDTLLSEAIADAEDYIESQTNRVFEAASDVVRFYVREALSDEDPDLLLLDGDLLTVNTLMNGDSRHPSTYTAAPATDQLTLADATVYAQLATATGVTVFSTTNDPPAPLVEGTMYYVILVASPIIQLATTSALAQAGTAIDITDAGTGTHTLYTEGTLIANTEYWLHPRNLGPPYHGIRLKSDSADYWEFDTDCFVGVNGDWGYSTTPPADIKRAATVLAAYFYKQKDSQVFDTTAIPEAGVITIPAGIPATATRIIERYKRYL